MKERIIPSAIVSAAILLAALCLCLFAGNAPAAGDGAPIPAPQSDAYKIAKIEELMDRVMNREVVEDALLFCLGDDETLRSQVAKHNELTAQYTQFFAPRAANTLIGVLQWEDFDSAEMVAAAYYANLPENIRAMAQRITHCSLSRNCTQLLLADPVLAPIIAVEGGGSAGMWPYWWHTTYLDNLEDAEKAKQDLAAYFDFEDELIAQLDEYRLSLLPSA